MEKITALIDKLQELKNKDAALSDLAYYTQLLYAELMCAKGSLEREKPSLRKKVAVIMPGYQSRHTGNEASAPEGKEESRLKEDLASQEQEIKGEVSQVKEEKAGEMIFAKPYTSPTEDVREYRPKEPVAPKTLFDAHEEPVYPASRPRAPLLNTNGKELNEVIADNKPSLNDRLKSENVELAVRINGSTQVKDLTKAIDINDKFLFINELFRGDRNMYDRSIKTINECSDLESAEYWIERELKIKLGWQERDNTVQQFYQLVKKRFLAA